MLRGIDISSHQAAFREQEMVKERTQFIIIKATGGGTYKNPRYPLQLAKARTAGRLVGHYHYAHELTFETHQPQGRFTPEQEADHFLATVNVLPGEIVVLDIEDPDAWGNLSDWALRWLRRVEQRLGCKPFLYTYPSYLNERRLVAAELSSYPLWYAYYRVPYNDNLPFPAPPAPFTKLTMWQWSGGTRVAGFDFDTDENLFFGSAEDFKRLGRPGVVVQPPFVHAPGFLGPPLVDTMNWGGDTAGIIVSRETVVYNDESKTYYRLNWDASDPKTVKITEIR